jgi:site-specific DNA-methyltransferase (adenine-specific)
MRDQAKPADNEWAGWGTCLKPAHEPIALARKPIKLSIAKNCQKHGVGALNIDATRVPYDDPAEAEADAAWRAKWGGNQTGGAPVFQGTTVKKKDKPVGGKGTPATHKNFSAENTDKEKTEFEPWEASQIGRFPSNVIGEIEGYQKYFYCPKVSRAERHIGFDEYNSVKTMMEHMNAYYVDNNDKPFIPQNNDPYMIYIPGKGKVYPHGLKHEYSEWCKKNKSDLGNVGNNHPTVKPIELMKYLIKLITPTGGTVLDPFNGSGSTGCAAVELGHPYIGCELDPAYVEIATKRIEAWYAQANPTTFRRLFDLD